MGSKEGTFEGEYFIIFISPVERPKVSGYRYK